MSEREADTVVILSSELISKITEEYFNKTMFKQKVEIVDLKPTDSGYMFSVAFVKSIPKVTEVLMEINASPTTIANEALSAVQRASNGQFMKVRR